MAVNAFENILQWSNSLPSETRSRYLWVYSRKDNKITWKRRESFHSSDEDKRLETIFTEMNATMTSIKVGTVERIDLFLKLKHRTHKAFHNHQKRFKFTLIRLLYQWIFERGLQKAHQILQNKLKSYIQEHINDFSEDNFGLLLQCTSFLDLNLSNINREKLRIVIDDVLNMPSLNQKTIVHLLTCAPKIALDQFEKIVQKTNSTISLSHLTDEQIIIVFKYKRNNINSLSIDTLKRLAKDLPPKCFSHLSSTIVRKLDLNDLPDSAVLNIPFYSISKAQLKNLHFNHWSSKEALEFIKRKDFSFWNHKLGLINTSQWPVSDIISVLKMINPVKDKTRKYNLTINCKDWTARLFFDLEKEINRLNLHLESFYRIIECLDFSSWSNREIEEFLLKNDIDNCDIKTIERSFDKISNLQLKKLSLKHLQTINYDLLSKEQIQRLLKLTAPLFPSNPSLERNVHKIDYEFFGHLTPKALKSIHLNNLSIEQILHINFSHLSSLQLRALDLDRFDSWQLSSLCGKLSNKIQFINPATLVKNLNRIPTNYYLWIQSKKQLQTIDFKMLNAEQLRSFNRKQIEWMQNFKKTKFQSDKKGNKKASNNFKKCLQETLKKIEENNSGLQLAHKNPIYEKVKNKILEKKLKTKPKDLGFLDKKNRLTMNRKQFLSIFHPDKNLERKDEADELFKLAQEALNCIEGK